MTDSKDSSRTRDGITTRHARQCPAFKDADAGCKCKPTYQVQVWSATEKRRKTRTFPTHAAARGWRDDARGELRRGTMVIGQAPTVREAWTECEALMRAGVLLTRSGDPYKPSTIRGYDEVMRIRLLPQIGALPLNELRSTHLSKMVERWLVERHSPSTIHNTLNPLRVVYRRAMRVGDVSVNPTSKIELPAVRGQRERFASPLEAGRLIDLAPHKHRAIWATAFYAGLRRGELLALDWERDVDLKRGMLRVTKSWDLVERELVDVKSRSGKRDVPIISRLRPLLLEHAMLTGRRTGFVFGRDAEKPFTPDWVQEHADDVWGAAEGERAARVKAGELPKETPSITRITLHECRHTYASLMIAAQVHANTFNPKVLQTLMGHSSIQITYDRYGHLFPGSETEAGETLERYLEASDG